MAKDKGGFGITCCGGGLTEQPEPFGFYEAQPDGGFMWMGMYCPRCGMVYTVQGEPALDEGEDGLPSGDVAAGRA